MEASREIPAGEADQDQREADVSDAHRGTPLNIHYLEPSAWLKRHFSERGSAWIRDWIDADARAFACASLGVIEIFASLARRQRAGDMSHRAYVQATAEVERDFANVTVVSLDDDVLAIARTLTATYALRGADTIHLASAIVLRSTMESDDDSVVVITADRELAEAARGARFVVLNPEDQEN